MSHRVALSQAYLDDLNYVVSRVSGVDLGERVIYHIVVDDVVLVHVKSNLSEYCGGPRHDLQEVSLPGSNHEKASVRV